MACEVGAVAAPTRFAPRGGLSSALDARFSLETVTSLGPQSPVEMPG